MFYCVLIKSKLLGYAQNELNKHQALKVEKHLAHCPDCKQIIYQYKNLITLTALDKPGLNQAFWNKFDAKLNINLAREKDVIDVKTGYNLFKPKFLPRFALASAMAFCLVLVMVLTPLKNVIFKNSIQNVLTEDKLIETALLLDGFDEIDLDNDEESFIDEFILQMSLEDA
ncbi:MAG: zf-HC2 domain-containing protein [Candidatus Omnitrophota bacterium]